jgi:hypothetical protein
MFLLTALKPLGAPGRPNKRTARENWRTTFQASSSFCRKFNTDSSSLTVWHDVEAHPAARNTSGDIFRHPAVAQALAVVLMRLAHAGLSMAFSKSCSVNVCLGWIFWVSSYFQFVCLKLLCGLFLYRASMLCGLITSAAELGAEQTNFRSHLQALIC